jgi:hypothetical protein
MQKRQQEKKQMLESVKKYRKGIGSSRTLFSVYSHLGGIVTFSFSIRMMLIVVYNIWCGKFKNIIYIAHHSSSFSQLRGGNGCFRKLLESKNYIFFKFSSTYFSWIGQKGKPEFLKDDDEFDVNTEKGTKRPAPSKAQGYCLYIKTKNVSTDKHSVFTAVLFTIHNIFN